MRPLSVERICAATGIAGCSADGKSGKSSAVDMRDGEGYCKVRKRTSSSKDGRVVKGGWKGD